MPSRPSLSGDAMLTLSELKKRLTYNPVTGVFTHLDRRAGKTVSGIDTKGYGKITINYRRYFLHRLAWFYMTGEWPKVIDHINGVRNDNRWCNLREASTLMNARNMRRPKNNTSGVVGVFWYARDQKWQAQIRTNGRIIILIRTRDKEEAVRIRKAAEVQYGFHPNHGRAA